MSQENETKESALSLKALSAVLTTFFRLLYNQFAWTYDWVAWIVSLGRWKSWVMATLSYLPGPKVLELGHGPGHLQAALIQAGIHGYGIDASSYMSRTAHSTMLKKIRSMPLLVNGYAQFIPFQNAAFNQVVATFPTEYIYDLTTLQEIHRILQPGGRLVILLVAWITGRGWLERAAAWLFRVTKQAPAQGPTPNGTPALRAALGKQLVERLEDNGFQVQVEFKPLESSVLMIIVGDKV
jgi:SAM-dependent methyltransferase